MKKLLLHKARQAREMIICEATDRVPQECGHWYSPKAVEEFCASKQKEIEGLHASARFWNDRANDNQQQIHELAAQIEVMQKALDSRKVIGFVRGYDVVLREDPYSDAVPCFTLDIGLLQAAQITPFEALAQRDAEVAAKALEDAADWHGEADWPTHLIKKAAEIRSRI